MYSAIIIDDEFKPALALQAKIVEHFKELGVVHVSNSIINAKQAILELKPHIIFLDINMNPGSGFEILEFIATIGLRTATIITSAYNQNDYYRRAIQLNAIDYLLKPVIVEELAVAIASASKKLQDQKTSSDLSALVEMFSYNYEIVLKTTGGKIKLSPNDIVYCEANGNYSTIYTINSAKEFIGESIKDVEIKLQGTTVVRVDRSYLINTKYIYKIDERNATCFFQSHVKLQQIKISEAGIKVLSKKLN